jgi:spore germination protein KB
MRVERIANRQLLFIIFIMRTTVVLATLPVLTSAEARQDAWASSILTFVGTLGVAFLIVGLGTRFPRLTVVEFSQKLLGTVGGGLVSFIILWSFLHLASIEVRIYTEMIIVGFLPDTPIVFLTAVLVIAAVVAAFAGIEVIGRVADLIFPIFLTMLVLSIGSLFIEAQFFNLQPVLARGFKPVVEGSIVPIAVGSQLLVAGMLIPLLIKPKKALGTIFLAVLGASLALISVATLTVAILGPDEGMRATFPFFKAIRAIQVSEFLERIEILAIFAWGFGLFVALATFIYCGARGAAQLFKITDYRYLLLPMGVTWVVITIHNFANVFQIRSFLSPQIMGPYGFSLVLFPYGLLWLSYLIRKALGQNPEAEGRGEDE